VGCILALAFVINQPERGQVEKNAAVDKVEEARSSYWQDLLYLIKVKSFVWSTIGYTSVVFVTGTLSWWAPTAFAYSEAWSKELHNISMLPHEDTDQLSLIFGALTCVAGIVGVAGGTFLAQWWKNGTACFRYIRTDRADPLVSAVGSILAFPLLFAGLHLIRVNKTASWISTFFAITFVCLNWAINVDMLLYIILPRRRSVASSWQIMISHLFGDASGPYIIGLVSDWIRGKDESMKAYFQSLLYAFYIPNVLLIISAVAFGLAAIFVLRDKANFETDMGLRKKTATTSVVNGKGTGLEA
jgi:hypothetical protein